VFKRLYVEKKPGFNVEAVNLTGEIKQQLAIARINSIRVVNRYDITSDIDVSDTVYGVFAEVNQDDVSDELVSDAGDVVFGVEYQLGQYDMRCDSAEQCVRLLKPGCEVKVRHAKIYVVSGGIGEAEKQKIIRYIVNPVDSQLTDLGAFKERSFVKSGGASAVIEGFRSFGDGELEKLLGGYGLAMNLDDLRLIRDYFESDEKRDPTETEIKVLDTYWSDHCRHTTFLTHLNEINFGKGPVTREIKKDYARYLQIKKELGRSDRPVTLMDLATIGAKYHRHSGLDGDVEVSDEINACSYEVPVDTPDGVEDFLIMFKNETHNHPTEIEPFGGAATCLGGAIRDPLSGRAYVYQSMRVTGSADPTAPVEVTPEGKLNQRKITTQAARGFSSYGNQIGLCTGQVREYYHPDFVAKRMEVGAVIAAAPKANVRRIKPEKGDVVYVIGGRTGRDGIGGASGSSKEHTEKSVDTAGSEVQKGNAIEERKLQRLFRRGEFARLIKKCNDFGAGGVSVAIGELADSLDIDLNSLLLKYEGLTPTEIAISESQERMAVIISPDDEAEFLSYVKSENIEYSKSALVTDSGRLIMRYDGRTVLNLKRDFINTNGASRSARVSVNMESALPAEANRGDFKALCLAAAAELNVCSQQGLCEMFDNTIGASNVVMPFGGKYARTPSDVMVSRIPLDKGASKTVSVMAHGYDPFLGKANPYLSGIYCVVSCIAKLVCAGADYAQVKLSMQEYFEKLRDDPHKWAKPFAALLGALKVQLALGVSAIGGKDSMSGSFEDIDVPPSILCFGVACTDEARIVTNEFKPVDSQVALIRTRRDENGIIDLDDFRENLEKTAALIESGAALGAKAVGAYGVNESIMKMCLGNAVGFEYDPDFQGKLNGCDYGDMLVQLAPGTETGGLCIVGKTNGGGEIAYKEQSVSVADVAEVMERPLAGVFPISVQSDQTVSEVHFASAKRIASPVKIAKPRVFVPVFPGTNCEYDTIRAFEEAGAVCESLVFRNISAADIKGSVAKMRSLIASCQIIALSGGFSAGDEPDGSGKFIVSVLHNTSVTEAIDDMLYKRDVLMIGICNGFQALVKTGLLPYGRIGTVTGQSPTLTFNTIGRHVAKLVRTKVVSDLSPWLYEAELGGVYNMALSHGEGRFVADEGTLRALADAGQIAAQYCDADGRVTADGLVNPNGSVMNIEAVSSANGRILGKMGHSERYVKGLYKNIPGTYDQKIFVSGVKYYS
jgi:phosphoribosylformylglycinamidine synthase